MPNGDPRDGFFSPTLTLMIDSYNPATSILVLFLVYYRERLLNRLFHIDRYSGEVPPTVETGRPVTLTVLPAKSDSDVFFFTNISRV